MIGLAIDLLRHLASGIIPGSSTTSSQPAQPGAADFAKLLAQAKDGQLASNQPVSVSPRSKLNLSPDQMQRLSVAADRAQAAGLHTAMVMLDGKPLLMDVQSRQVLGAFDASAREASTVDGVVAAPSAQDAAQPMASTGIVPLPGAFTNNLSLARILQSATKANSAA